VRLLKKIEQAKRMGKIEGFVKDSRTMIRDELRDDSKGGKP
jgi:hypothetical protein